MWESKYARLKPSISYTVRMIQITNPTEIWFVRVQSNVKADEMRRGLRLLLLLSQQCWHIVCQHSDEFAEASDLRKARKLKRRLEIYVLYHGVSPGPFVWRLANIASFVNNKNSVCVIKWLCNLTIDKVFRFEIYEKHSAHVQIVEISSCGNQTTLITYLIETRALCNDGTAFNACTWSDGHVFVQIKCHQQKSHQSHNEIEFNSF